MKKDDFKQVTPTAMKHVYYRALAGIPNAQKMWEEVKQKYNVSEELFKKDMQVFSEVRYRMTDELLGQTGIDQVLEVAAGWSPRGLNFCKNNPNATYVEMELEEGGTTADKREVLEKIGDVPDNLHLITGNALDPNDFEKASEHFDPRKPVAVINEGLVAYFDFDQKSQYAKNVHGLLSEFGGKWITCDFNVGRLSVSKHKDFFSKTSIYTTAPSNHPINNPQNQFKDQAQVDAFLEQHGFTAAFHSTSDKVTSKLKTQADKQRAQKYDFFATMDLIKED
jgi:O-methyltransferase involved in polyketide biosynthesis